MNTQNIQILNEEILLKPKTKDLIASEIDRFSNQQSHKYGARTNNGSGIPDWKTKKDIAVGKWGEFFAAMDFHEKYGFPLLVPDTKIYDYSHKSWDHDLPYAEKFGRDFPNVAVKTCTQYTWDHYGLSWMLQYNNPQDALFKINDPNVLVACMVVSDCDPVPDSGILVALVPWGKIKLNNPGIGEIKLGEPVSQKFRGLKKCIYYDDIVKAV